MNLDIRTPIALMFGLLGIIVTGYGFMTRNDAEALKPSLGININLWWGLVMLGFALVMFLWSRIDKGDAPRTDANRERPRH